MVKPLFPFSVPAKPTADKTPDRSPKPLFPTKADRNHQDVIQKEKGQIEAARVLSGVGGGGHFYSTPGGGHSGPSTFEPPKPQVGKVLFPDKAVLDSIEDLPDYIKHHPVIVGMTNYDVRRAYILSKNLTPSDTKALFEYGDSRRELFTDVVNKIVEAAKQSQLESANTYLLELCEKMTSVDVTKIGSKQKQSWLERFVHGDSEPAVLLKDIISTFDHACIDISSGMSKIKQICASLMVQVQDLEKLYSVNKESFAMLQVEIAAGRFFYEQALPALDQLKPVSAFDGNDIAYKKMCVERFANKVADLEMTAQSVLTNAPQIRLMQLNIQDLGERTKNVGLGFAKWKSQFSTIVTALQNDLNKSKTSNFSQLLQKQSNLLAEFSVTQQSLKNI